MTALQFIIFIIVLVVLFIYSIGGFDIDMKVEFEGNLIKCLLVGFLFTVPLSILGIIYIFKGIL